MQTIFPYLIEQYNSSVRGRSKFDLRIITYITMKVRRGNATALRTEPLEGLKIRGEGGGQLENWWA